MAKLFKRHSASKSQKILLSYKGKVTFDNVYDLIQRVESELSASKLSLKSQKKVNNVTVEIFQNLAHNIEFDGVHFALPEEIWLADIKVWIEDNKCFIATGNYILGSRVSDLETRLLEINSLDMDGVRELYRRVLADGIYHGENSGGGLGFIDITRRSKRKFDFSFKTVDDQFSYFNFETFIPLDLNE